MRILAFGTYDAAKHPRVQVLIDGLRRHGHDVRELNRPLGLSTADKVEALRDPLTLPRHALRLARRWVSLVAGAPRYTGPNRPQAVLVGYLGHFDVLLARLLFPGSTIVLDHLIFAADTARDRGTPDGLRTRLLAALDALALRAADVVVVDTDEHRGLVPAWHQGRVVVVDVGATDAWFRAAEDARPPGGPMSVVFFGLFTPLQGTETVGRALRLLHERGVPVHATLVGTGQDAEAVRALVDGLPGIRWHDWIDGAELPALVAGHDVCLGIFGTTGKAGRVVPNKVYQGTAAGCAVVTSDTAPQRRVLGDVAELVPAGDAEALATVLADLAARPDRRAALSADARAWSQERFTPQAVTAPLDRALAR
ncbi:glycosyltransferase family 4 protein [Georgenia satyanarayanai]|uniref:glycosyltransferase family 4 protein n=1 Tax=Georgenia satyanarayanai TaxID=860221 RepID=UPI00203AEAAC|nr:glycosyltransferase family 4 protein [Georgenia satyanarayanai]MCM3661048.1 glycosyltransferase family 4 protein [Georgenia satyanarayanai]